MKLIKWFLTLVITSFSVASLAVSTVLTDPTLEESENTTNIISGSISTEISRNTRISTENFTSVHQADGLFSTLNTRTELYFTAALTSLLSSAQKYSVLKDVQLLSTFSYRRPVSAQLDTIKQICWNPILCFGDINIGAIKPLIQKGLFSMNGYLIFRVPFSKNSFDQSLIGSLNTAVSTNYKLPILQSLHTSINSYHSISGNAHVYNTANKNNTAYNVPLNTFHQLGLQIKKPKYPVIPTLFLYGGYNFYLNYYGSVFHSVSLNSSLKWSIKKNIEIITNISWQDRVINRPDTIKKEVKVFDPDNTYVSLNGRYYF